MRRIISGSVIVAVAVLMPALALAGDQRDEAVAEQIATVLRDSGRMQNYSVGVKYKAGRVWLSGRVANNEQMQSALEVISEMDNVEEIVNNLTISPGKKSLQQPAGVQTSNTVPAAASGAPTWENPIPRPPVQQVSQRPQMAPQMPPAQMQAAQMQQMQAAQMQAAQMQMARSAGAAPMGDGNVTPAGFHRLAARKAARHACPPNMYMPAGNSVNPPAMDQPYMPNYAWPSYAAYPNYSALTYPQQYSPTAWPFIGPFYPYPQVPLGWRKVALEWDDGWWFLDFYDRSHH
ncbi:MAG: BON domain-containing protein [Planctomycetota bacterium]|nr:MAG: BON domain-containing protein [Planctomycetota bacterium]